MPTFTPNFGLAKPLVNNVTDQDLWGGQLNDDMDIIDTQLKVAQDFQSTVKTSAYSVIDSDRKALILCDATSAGFTVSLLSAATAGNGFTVSIKKTDSSSNVVTIDPAGAETVDGSATLLLSSQNDSAIIVSDGLNWYSVAREPSVAIPDASTSVKGIIQLATAAEVAAGTDTTKAITPDTLKDALGFSSGFTSTDITITAGGGSAQNHPLGATPKYLEGFIVCATAELGYSVGDRISMSGQSRAVAGVMQISLWANATQVGVGFGASGGGIIVANKSTKSESAITNSNWRYVIEAS